MPGEISTNAKTQPPAELFRASHCFIPHEFQRLYVCTAEQIYQLWNDIISITNNPAQKHFTGIILPQNNHPAGHIPPIIDDQRRLTTIQLLIAALRTTRQQQGSPVDAETIENMYLANRNGVLLNQPELAYKTRHAPAQDAVTFQRFIKTGSIASPEHDREKQLELLPDATANSSAIIAARTNPDDQALPQDLWSYSRPYWREQHGSVAHARSNIGHPPHYWPCAEAGELVLKNQNRNDALPAYQQTIRKNGITGSLKTLNHYAESYRPIQSRNLFQSPKFLSDFHTSATRPSTPCSSFAYPGCTRKLKPRRWNT